MHANRLGIVLIMHCPICNVVNCQIIVSLSFMLYMLLIKYILHRIVVPHAG